MIQICKIYLAIFFLLVCCTDVTASPGITNATVNGSIIDIAGTSFGNKSTAAPIRFDDFESSDVDDSIATATSWYSDVDHVNKMFVSADNQRQGSTKNIKSISDYTDGMAVAYRNSVGFADTNKILISLWIYFSWGVASPDYDGVHQIKTWRVASSVESGGNVIYPDFANFSHNYVTSDQTYYQNHRGTDSNTQYFSHDYIIDDGWMHMMLVADIGTAGNADGEWYGWLGKNGSAYSTIVQNAVEVLNGGYGDIDAIKFDNYIGNCDTSGGPTECTDPTNVTIYYDDIYIDNTWARVEIGDAGTYDGCTHREIQIPTSWNSSSITSTLNQGSLPDGTAYLYVVDENGIMNETGYPITLGNSDTIQITSAIPITKFE